MRWYVLSLILILAVGSGAWALLQNSNHSIQKFCDELPLGAEIAQVRVSAQDAGLRADMEPYFQMSVRPRFWHPSHPSCRVFFNADHVVGYRKFQFN